MNRYGSVVVTAAAAGSFFFSCHKIVWFFIFSNVFLFFSLNFILFMPITSFHLFVLFLVLVRENQWFLRWKKTMNFFNVVVVVVSFKMIVLMQTVCNADILLIFFLLFLLSFHTIWFVCIGMSITLLWMPYCKSFQLILQRKILWIR